MTSHGMAARVLLLVAALPGPGVALDVRHQGRQGQAPDWQPPLPAGESPLDLKDINARGIFGGFNMQGRRPDHLSRPAMDFGLTAANAELDGAGQEWPLWLPTQQVPEERPGDAEAQVIARADPTDMCSQGDISTYAITEVAMPALVPFLVPFDQENRKDIGIIVAPGGGRKFLSWNKEGTHPAKYLNSIGISAFVLKYRVPVDTLETNNKLYIDSERAVSFVRYNATKLGLNASRIGFMGFSGGGLVTGMVSTSHRRHYEAVDEVDTASFHPDFALILYRDGPPRLAKYAPPTFLGIAQDDPCAKPAAAVEYYEALKRARDALDEIHVYAGGKHGFGDCSMYTTANATEPACAWTVNAQFWIERLFGLERPLAEKALTAPE